MKGEIASNTVIVGDFNTPLTPMDRSSKQKLNKETQALNDKIDQIDVINIYGTFHPKVAEYTFFSSSHRIIGVQEEEVKKKGPEKIFEEIILQDRLQLESQINLRKFLKLKLYQASFLTTTLIRNQLQEKKL